MASDLDKKQYNQAVEVKEMLSSNGWKIVSSVLDDMEKANINSAIDNGEVEARMMVKAIRKLRQAIQSILGLGSMSYKQMKKE